MIDESDRKAHELAGIVRAFLASAQRRNLGADKALPAFDLDWWLAQLTKKLAEIDAYRGK